MVHAGGRPRTTTPPKDELIELGEELVKWATEETDELRCRFCDWYSLQKGLLHKEWDLMVQKPEFRGYYEKAQTALAKRYLDGSVRDSIGHRFLRIYSPEIRKEEDEVLKLKLELEYLKKKQLIDHQAESNAKNISSLVSPEQAAALSSIIKSLPNIKE